MGMGGGGVAEDPPSHMCREITVTGLWGPVTSVGVWVCPAGSVQDSTSKCLQLCAEQRCAKSRTESLIAEVLSAIFGADICAFFQLRV